MTLNKPKIFSDIDTINASLGEKVKYCTTVNDFLSAGLKVANFQTLNISNITNNQIQSNTHIAGGGATLLSVGTPQNNVANLILNGVSNVTIEGLVFDGNKSVVGGDINTHVVQILLTNCSNIEIRNCYFKNSNGSGIVLNGSTNKNIKIHDCTFIGIDSCINGSNATNGDNIFIYDNDFDGTGNTNSEPVTLNYFNNVYVHNNRFYNKTTSGCCINNCKNVLIHDNVFDSLTYGIVAYTSTNVKVHNNIGVNNTEAFIVTLGCNITILNNFLSLNKRDLYVINGMMGISATGTTIIKYVDNVTKDSPPGSNYPYPVDIRVACTLFFERNKFTGDMSGYTAIILLYTNANITLTAKDNWLTLVKTLVEISLFSGTLTPDIVNNKNVSYSNLTGINCYSYSTNIVTSS